MCRDRMHGAILLICAWLLVGCGIVATPTPEGLTIQAIKAGYAAATDVQKRNYSAQMHGRQINNWIGVVLNVTFASGAQFSAPDIYAAHIDFDKDGTEDLIDTTLTKSQAEKITKGSSAYIDQGYIDTVDSGPLNNTEVSVTLATVINYR